MRVTTFISAALGPLVLAAVTAMPASALNAVSYVAGTGNDNNFTNNCANPAAPCQTLTRAVVNTVAGGQVVCLGGGFVDFFNGAIEKSVTIDCPTGVNAGGLIINAPNGVVRLRNLTINGLGAAIGGGLNFGIAVQFVKTLHIENCHIVGFGPNSATTPAIGLDFGPTGAANLHIIDSVISDNGFGTTGGAILIKPPAGASASVVIERTRIHSNTGGIIIDGTQTTAAINVQIRDSVVANNSGIGIVGLSPAGKAIIRMVVDRTSAVGNGQAGIQSNGSNSHIVFATSTVMFNGTGLQSVNAGNLYSHSDNKVEGNNNGDGGPTAVLATK